ncbi:hypothetical protein ACR6HW_02405 [Fusibacter sp. JL298sf-3]
MLTYKKKVQRMLDFQKEKTETEWDDGKVSHDEVFKYTKEDILAIVISALMVFGPVLLVLCGIMYLIFRGFY